MSESLPGWPRSAAPPLVPQVASGLLRRYLDAAQDVFDRYRPRLRKVFAYFAVSSPQHDRQDAREFLFMLKSLGCLDRHTLTLMESARIFCAVTCFLGDLECDRCEFSSWMRALAVCIDVKTSDGISQLGERIENYLVSEFFQRVRQRTNIAALWL